MIPAANTPEWLEWRKTKVGASEAAIVMGLSPWSTPFQLYEEKLGLRPPKDLSAAMFRGMELEEKARRAYEEMTDRLIFPQVVVHEVLDWCIASLDGMNLEGTRICEIKCPGRETHRIAEQGCIPEHYMPQLQHQMFVTGLDSVDYYSFDGREGVLITVERDDKFIEKMMKEEKKFMECLYTMTPPPLTDKDYRDLSKDEEWNTLECQYVQVCNQLKELESYKESLREKMIDRSDGFNSKGNQVRMTKKVSKGRVEYDKIDILTTVNLDDYRKPNIISYVITY